MWEERDKKLVFFRRNKAEERTRKTEERPICYNKNSAKRRRKRRKNLTKVISSIKMIDIVSVLRTNQYTYYIWGLRLAWPLKNGRKDTLAHVISERIAISGDK